MNLKGDGADLAQKGGIEIGGIFPEEWRRCSTIPRRLKEEGPASIQTKPMARCWGSGATGGAVEDTAAAGKTDA